MEDLKDDFKSDIECEEIETEEEKQEYWGKWYKDDYNDLIEQLDKLENELESL